MVTVEKFIANFKKGFDEKYLEEVFLNGNCYHFALILKEMYDGEIIYDPHEQHFVVKIDDNYYDIQGKVQPPMDEYPWNEMEEIDSEEYEAVKYDCVYKV